MLCYRVMVNLKVGVFILPFIRFTTHYSTMIVHVFISESMRWMANLRSSWIFWLTLSTVWQALGLSRPKYSKFDCQQTGYDGAVTWLWCSRENFWRIMHEFLTKIIKEIWIQWLFNNWAKWNKSLSLSFLRIIIKN